MEYEPADPNYGADADGGRGIYVPACWVCCNDDCSEEGKAVAVESWDREDDYSAPLF